MINMVELKVAGPRVVVVIKFKKIQKSEKNSDWPDPTQSPFYSFFFIFSQIWKKINLTKPLSTAAFHASVRGSFPGPGVLKETQMFLPHSLVKLCIVGSLRAQKVADSASDSQCWNFDFCVWRAMSSHHPQEVLLAQFSLYVQKTGLKRDSFHVFSLSEIHAFSTDTDNATPQS